MTRGKKKVRVFNCLPMEIYILEDMRLEVLKDMANTIGKMALIIVDSSFLECDTAEACGR